MQVQKLNTKLKEINQIEEDTATIEDSKSLRNLKLQLKQQVLRGNELEDQLVEAKMSWATLDMENDQLTVKLQQKNQALKRFSGQVTKLEVELVNAKQ